MAAAASMAGIAGAPQFAFGQSTGGKTFVKVFMRGGADGLHLFPAIGDIEYYNHRPNLAIRPPSDTDVDSALNIGNNLRGMNPNLAPLMEIFDAGRMMVAPATALSNGGRSHFENQRWVGKGVRDDLVEGYLNRYLQEIPGVDHPLRGASLGRGNTGSEFGGKLTIPAITNAKDFEVFNKNFCDPGGCADNRLTEMMTSIATNERGQSAVTSRIRENQMIMLDSVKEVQNAGANYAPNAGGLDYSNTTLGNGLRLVAQLLKAGVPLEVAGIDWKGNFDTHANQGAGRNEKWHESATDLLTFYRDMGAHMDNVVVLVCTEFGRTVIENGNRGTDHGSGSSWFAFGGPASGGVGPDVPSVARENLAYGRFIPVLTDFRDLVAEVMVRHMDVPESLISTLLPGHNFTDHQLFTRSV